MKLPNPNSERRSSPQRVLLVSSNALAAPYPVFPLGVAFLQAALENAGHETRIWDALVHGRADLDAALNWADAVGVSMRNIDNVSASRPAGYIKTTWELIDGIRARRELPIIIGGSAFSIFPEELLELFQLPWGIAGEGEGTVLQWLDLLAGMQRPQDIPGLVYWRDGRAVANPSQVLSSASIPRISPDLNWVRSYVAMGAMVGLQTQRGCAFRCTYCTYPVIEGRCYRHRTASDIVAEFHLMHEAGVRYVFFTDSVFNTDPHHVEAVCTALIAADTGINWGCFARPQALRADLIDLMIAAGMQHIEFGSDSFCDQTLRSYGKSFRFADILSASELTAGRKVHVCHYIIFGGPGETEHTIAETVANARLLPAAPIFAFSGMRIYPRTPLHNHMQRKLDYSELLQPRFYENPNLPAADIDRLIRDHTAGNPNWVLSDHADDHAMATAALRSRGKQGPLWEYLDLMRRMSPR